MHMQVILKVKAVGFFKDPLSKESINVQCSENSYSTVSLDIRISRHQVQCTLLQVLNAA